MNFCQTSAVDIMMDVERDSGADRWRRECGLRSWLKHQRPIVRMVLAETFHHSSARFPPKFEEEWVGGKAREARRPTGTEDGKDQGGHELHAEDNCSHQAGPSMTVEEVPQRRGSTYCWKVKHSWERMGKTWVPQVAESSGTMMASAVFFLVHPLTQWKVQQTLELLRDLGVQRRTCARHGSQDNFQCCATVFSGR